MKKAISFSVQFVVVALIALILPVAMVGLVAYSTEFSHPEYVKKLSGLDISGSAIVSVEDTHGGFHGDGHLIVQFDCTEIADSVMEQMPDWNMLPLTNPLQLFMYGTENTIGNGERWGVPEFTNGYYFFWDRHSQSADPTSDSELNNRHSYNFTLLLYDADHSQLYLLELDT